MANVNSFSETVNRLINQTNIALDSLVQLNKSVTTEEDTVTIEVQGTDTVTGDPCTYTYSIPSYNKTLSELSNISNTVDTFVRGEGVVLLNDGTFREVKTVPVAKSPDRITGVTVPTSFDTKTNWFFESLIFPKLVVTFDLKNKIDDRSDRVVVKRIIFDNFDDTETQWFKDNVIGNTFTYYEAIQLLNRNNKKYWEDDQVYFLPLKTTPYEGDFIIQRISTINAKQWYYLNTLNYGETDEQPLVRNIQLNVGDLLRFNNSIYKIEEVNVPEKRVRLTAQIGIERPVATSKFYIYSTPFEEKTVDVAVGYNECNILFIKGVNDDFNIIGDDWSESISFYTNELILKDNTQTLETYYHNFVSDFGKKMEGEAKEKFVPAFFGVTPDAPQLTSEQFQVVQINKQLNASLDTEEIKNTQTQVERTKTIIDSIKNTIAQQKAELVELTDPAQRSDLQSKIDTNTSQLSKKTVEYQSLVKSLATAAFENEAVLGSPKYRVRTFFDIPKGKRSSDNPAEKPQEIIQFDIAYRYLRLDGTGNPLDTFAYTDPSTGQTVRGTFTDWEIKQSSIKKKTYDASTGTYVWKNENISDGQEVNINQVDIPITKGELVQVRIRSVSEAGWPLNPLKSEWSDTVTVQFPANLQSSTQLENILTDAQAEETSITLQETLDAAGVYTHLDDGVPNPNSAEGTYYKHQARFLAYDLPTKDINGNTVSVQSTDLQNTVTNLADLIFVKIANPAGSGFKTVTISEVLQELINDNSTVYSNLTNNN